MNSRRTLPVCLFGIAVLSLLTSRQGRATPAPEVVFSSRCSSCHSVGKGDVVGPDLKGVTGRHDRAWLHRFIHSSQSVIRSGDSKAVAIYQRYGRQVMPDHPLTDPEIDSLLAFIEAGGPGAGEGEVRPASTASDAEYRRGRDLFLGRRLLAHGGAACIHCHTAGAEDPLAAGTLAPDLTRVYLHYKDWGLVSALERPQVDLPMMAELYGNHPLTRDEAYALTVYLYRTATDRRPVANRTVESSRTAAFLGFGGSALLFWLTRRRR